MGNWWTIAGTILGALIAGFTVLLNSIYSAKSSLKRENRNRLIQEKERDIKELETLYQEILHSLDKLIRGLGFLEKNELEKYYKMEIRIELISTKEIVTKLSDVSKNISKMATEIPSMPEEFIPKFEEDYDRQTRLEIRKEAKKTRNEEAKKYTPQIRKEYSKLSELMKTDLKNRRIFDVDKYITYRKNI